MAFCVNPYSNDLDLSEASGMKLYDKATKGTTTKHNLTNDMEKAEEFMTSLKSDSRKFCFGPVTTRAEIQVPGHLAGTETIDLLQDFAKVTRERIIESAGVNWGCTFNADNVHDFTCVDTNDDQENALRVRSAMLGTYLENSLTEEGMKTLENYSELFTYINTDGNSVSDGLTMLHVILNMIMPSTKASINNKRAELMGMDPSKYDGDINKMTTRMQTLKAAIQNDSGAPYADFAIHLFAACEKSKVKGFADYATRLRSDWETDDDVGTDDDIVRKLTRKWNNECTKTEAAKQSSTSSKEDSNASKLLVLLTALVNQADGGNSSNSNSNRRGKRDGQSSISEWRKTKSFGDKVFKDGKQYYWCEQHQEGKGLYVTHHPKDHGKKITEWEHTDRSRNVKSSQPASSNESNSGDASSTSKLQLSDKMKSALTSQGLSSNDAESLLKGLQENSASGGVDFW